ncbi:MAG: zinc ribbon domain-containing protein, partial [Acidimicrobiales bacterium]|nr:zinc ribbon domain-containing protein [Acidimicrobiales bacterium]
LMAISAASRLHAFWRLALGRNPGRTLRYMPLYDYRCGTCDTVFEVRRPMSESGDSAACPAGHQGARRLLSVFAAVGGDQPAPMSGGCGGACACHPG